jgi:hypothetical protein
MAATEAKPEENTETVVWLEQAFFPSQFDAYSTPFNKSGLFGMILPGKT